MGNAVYIRYYGVDTVISPTAVTAADFLYEVRTVSKALSPPRENSKIPTYVRLIVVWFIWRLPGPYEIIQECRYYVPPVRGPPFTSVNQCITLHGIHPDWKKDEQNISS